MQIIKNKQKLKALSDLSTNPSSVPNNGILNRIGRSVTMGDGSTTLGKPVNGTPTVAHSKTTTGKTTQVYGDIPNSWANNNEDINSVVIGTSARTIGNSAFSSCDFLETFKMPDTITSIGNSTFNNCTGLRNITIGDSVTGIGSYSFAYCYNVSGSLTIPNSVKSIGQLAFTSISTGTLSLGNSVQTIGAGAFQFAKITGSLTIPNSITSIGSYAFNYCLFKNVYIDISKSIIDASVDVFASTPITGFHVKPANYVAQGWTLGAGQTIGGQTGITVVADYV